MGQAINSIDKSYLRFASAPSSGIRQKAKPMLDSFTNAKARREGRDQTLAGLKQGSGAGAALGKVVLSGLGIAAIIGATVAITKFSGQILSSVGGLGAHGGIVVGVFVGIAFLLTGILSAVAVAKKAQQNRALRADIAKITDDCRTFEDLGEQSELTIRGLTSEIKDLKVSVQDHAKLAENSQVQFEELQQHSQKVTQALTSENEELKACVQSYVEYADQYRAAYEDLQQSVQRTPGMMPGSYRENDASSEIPSFAAVAGARA